MHDAPRTEAVIDWLLHPDRSYTPHELATETVRRLREVEAAAGPRDVPTLPPPDPSLIDTLGEGADPDRPVRVLADDYPTIKPPALPGECPRCGWIVGNVRGHLALAHPE